MAQFKITNDDRMFFGLKRSTRFTLSISIQSMTCPFEADEAVHKWRL